MKELQTFCDYCGRHIQDNIALGLFLDCCGDCQDVKREDLEIDRDHHFCEIKCLYEWAKDQTR